MRTERELIEALAGSGKEIEKQIGMSLRNGQSLATFRKTIKWVLLKD